MVKIGIDADVIEGKIGNFRSKISLMWKRDSTIYSIYGYDLLADRKIF